LNFNIANHILSHKKIFSKMEEVLQLVERFWRCFLVEGGLFI